MDEIQSRKEEQEQNNQERLGCSELMIPDYKERLEELSKKIDIPYLKSKIENNRQYLLFFLNVCELLREKDFQQKDIAIKLGNISNKFITTNLEELISMGLIKRKKKKRQGWCYYYEYGINIQRKIYLEELRDFATEIFNQLTISGKIYEEKDKRDVLENQKRL